MFKAHGEVQHVFAFCWQQWLHDHHGDTAGLWSLMHQEKTAVWTSSRSLWVLMLGLTSEIRSPSRTVGPRWLMGFCCSHGLICSDSRHPDSYTMLSTVSVSPHTQPQIKFHGFWRFQHKMFNLEWMSWTITFNLLNIIKPFFLTVTLNIL